MEILETAKCVRRVELLYKNSKVAISDNFQRIRINEISPNLRVVFKPG